MAEETTRINAAETLLKPAEAAGMEEYRATPYYQSLGIDQLERQLAGYQADDETLRTQAENQYRPVYESEAEAARQEYERQVQGYRSQIAGVGAAYDRQRRAAGEAYDRSAAQLNNRLTARGLGRSSLVSTQGAYLEKQRNEALGDIDRDESAAINAINEKIALLTDQAAQSERTLAGNYARQLENRVNELKEKNQSAAVSLQLQIAALQQQGYEAYQNWLLKNREQSIRDMEFEAEYAPKTGGAGSSGGKSAASSTGAKKNQGAADAQQVASAAGNVIMQALNALKNKLSTKKSTAAVPASGAAALAGGSSDVRQTLR